MEHEPKEWPRGQRTFRVCVSCRQMCEGWEQPGQVLNLAPNWAEWMNGGFTPQD